MSDPAFDLLVPFLNKPQGNTLWLVDENIGLGELSRIRANPAITAISNRFDVVQLMLEQGINCRLNDFELGDDLVGFDQVLFRISKEKALVHHIINRSPACLRPGGEVLISGFKNEGIKTYIKKAEQYLGSIADKTRGEKTAQLARLALTEEAPGEPLEDKDYSSPRLLQGSQTAFFSKPGIFGWEKTDRGSQFLIEQLPGVLSRQARSPASIVDLGCGYGYLSIMASSIVAAPVAAVDNNIAAVIACEENFRYHKIKGQVVCDDCGSSLGGTYELLLCNPPFHQGFDVESDLTNRFLAASHRLLGRDGIALFVVNAFIPLERKAMALYDRVELVANNKSFKVLLLSR